MKKYILLTLIFCGTVLLCFQFFDLQAKENEEPFVTKKEAVILENVFLLSEKNIQEALNFLKMSIREESGPVLFFALGNLYFDSDTLILAKDAYKKAILKFPVFKKARLNLVRVYIKMDDFESAASQLQYIISHLSSGSSSFMLMGYVYYNLEHIIASETAYRNALLKDPENFDAYLGLAKCLLIQKRYMEATRLLNELLVKEPLKYELWSHLANTYMAMNDYEQALISLECANRLNVIQPEALATLGDLYLQEELIPDALSIYEKAFQSKTINFSRILRAISGFIALNKVKEAETLLSNARHLKDSEHIKITAKDHFTFFYQEARIFHLNFEYDASLKCYKKLLKSYPLNGKLLLSMGELYQQRQSMDQAFMCFDRASRIESFESPALIRMALIEVNREHYKKAYHLLKKARKLKPDDEQISSYMLRIKQLI